MRVPKRYIDDNHLRLGDTVTIEEPRAKQQQALNQLLLHAKKLGSIKTIPDPVAWQRQQRVSDDPWKA